MVRWRGYLVLVMLILLVKPLSTEDLDAEEDDAAEETEPEDSTEDEDSEDGEEESKAETKHPTTTTTLTTTISTISRTTLIARKSPLECYTCAFKAEVPSRDCLDPKVYKVHVMTCDNPMDQCFTKVINNVKGNFEALIRGCKSQCVPNWENVCCESSLCNDETFLRRVVQTKSQKVETKSSSKSLSPKIVMLMIALSFLQTIAQAVFS